MKLKLNPNAEVAIAGGLSNRPIIHDSGRPDETWQELLRVSPGEGEINSLWDKCFPITEVIDGHLIGQRDENKLRKLGVRKACRVMETYGAFISTIARVAEKEYGDFDNIRASMEEEITRSEAKIVELEDEAITLRDKAQRYDQAEVTWEKFNGH